MKVFKFGGASVKDAAGVKNLAEIISEYGAPGDVVIVSAMGKTTRHLEEMANKLYNGIDQKKELDAIRDYHNEVASNLELKEPAKNQLQSLLDKLSTDQSTAWQGSRKQLVDHLMAYGELLSTTIVEGYLNKFSNTAWVDVRDYIATDDNYNEAKVDWLLTSNLVKQRFTQNGEGKIYVTQGFLGRSSSGATTTLGKEGSDFTAAIIAHCCDAESVTIWKDVPGILSADPKILSSTQLFDQLSYQEAAEMTYYGAKVIHPKTIRPLAQKNIPLFVRSFITYKDQGTVINHEELTHRKIPSFIFKTNQVLVSFKVRDLSFIDERKLSLIFHTLNTLKIKLNMIQNSAVTLSACFDLDREKMDKLQDILKDEFEILYNDQLTLATIKNYNEESILEVSEGMEVLLEQKTRHNVQVLYRNVS